AAPFTWFLPALARFVAVFAAWLFGLLFQGLQFIKRDNFLAFDHAPPLFCEYCHSILKRVNINNLALAEWCADTLVPLGKLLARRHILLIFVDQTAAQPAAHAGNLRRIKRDTLCLRHLDRNRAEIGEEGAATAAFATRASPAQQLGNITRANLPHFDFGLKNLAQFTPQFTGVHPIFSSEHECQHTAVIVILRGYKLHLLITANFFGLLLAYEQGFVRFC